MHAEEPLRAVSNAECVGFVILMKSEESSITYRLNTEWEQVDDVVKVESGRFAQFKLWYDEDALFLEEMESRIEAMVKTNMSRDNAPQLDPLSQAIHVVAHAQQSQEESWEEQLTRGLLPLVQSADSWLLTVLHAHHFVNSHFTVRPDLSQLLEDLQLPCATTTLDQAIVAVSMSFQVKDWEENLQQEMAQLSAKCYTLQRVLREKSLLDRTSLLCELAGTKTKVQVRYQAVKSQYKCLSLHRRRRYFGEEFYESVCKRRRVENEVAKLYCM